MHYPFILAITSPWNKSNLMENANRRLQVPVDGRPYAYLLLLSILTFYLFYPSSKYFPSAHLEGGEPRARYYAKDKGMFYYMCVLTFFITS